MIPTDTISSVLTMADVQLDGTSLIEIRAAMDPFFNAIFIEAFALGECSNFCILLYVKN